MATTLKFVGGPTFKPGHAYSTPPLTVPLKERQRIDPNTDKPVVDEDGKPVMDVIRGWEVGDEVTFDRAFAENHGRLSAVDPDDDGDEWAMQHAAYYNDRFPEGQKPFQVKTKATKAGKEAAVTSAVDAAGAK